MPSKLGKHCSNRRVPWVFCSALNSESQFCTCQNRAWTLWPWDRAVRLPEISEVDKYITSQYCRCLSVNCHRALFSENTLKCQCCLQTSEKTSVILIKEHPKIVFLIYCWPKNILEKTIACCWDDAVKKSETWQILTSYAFDRMYCSKFIHVWNIYP